MTENQKLALIAAAAPNTVLRWYAKHKCFFAVDTGTGYHQIPRSHFSELSQRSWSAFDLLYPVSKGLLENDSENEGWRITEAGRRAVEEMVE